MHKKAAHELYFKIAPVLTKKHSNSKYIVGISGESGSGKSELAHALGLIMREKGYAPKIIYTDNFYKIYPKDRKKWREKNFDQIGPNEYNWIKLESVIEAFLRSKTCIMPCVDLVSNKVDRLITRFTKTNVLILDGLYAIQAPHIDLKVFIDLTYKETKANQILRLKEPMNAFRLRVLQQEHKAVKELKHKAHLIINKKYDVIEK